MGEGIRSLDTGHTYRWAGGQMSFVRGRQPRILEDIIGPALLFTFDTWISVVRLAQPRRVAKNADASLMLCCFLTTIPLIGFHLAV
jgi:hypothetical protein